MKTNTHAIYHEYKKRVTSLADNLTTSDLAWRRQALNDHLDALCRELTHEVDTGNISKARGSQYKNRLTSYTIKRHSK
jgi:hypothetical protein